MAISSPPSVLNRRRVVINPVTHKEEILPYDIDDSFSVEVHVPPTRNPMYIAEHFLRLLCNDLTNEANNPLFNCMTQPEQNIAWCRLYLFLCDNMNTLFQLVHSGVRDRANGLSQQLVELAASHNYEFYNEEARQILLRRFTESVFRHVANAIQYLV